LLQKDGAAEGWSCRRMVLQNLKGAAEGCCRRVPRAGAGLYVRHI
jgi:hypothetical protein